MYTDANDGEDSATTKARISTCIPPQPVPIYLARGTPINSNKLGISWVPIFIDNDSSLTIPIINSRDHKYLEQVRLESRLATAALIILVAILS